jgi:5,10-methylenetetrahydromethanopterin reductase
MQLAAVVANRVTLAVGADPARVGWAVSTIREASPDVPIGAYVNVLVDDDVERALALSSGSIASFARFSAMHGKVQGPVGEADRLVLEDIPRAYQLNHHFENAAQSLTLTPDFSRQYAILGPAGHCLERLTGLAELGIDRFHIVGAARNVSSEESVASRRRFVEGVLANLV